LGTVRNGAAGVVRSHEYPHAVTNETVAQLASPPAAYFSTGQIDAKVETNVFISGYYSSGDGLVILLSDGRRYHYPSTHIRSLTDDSVNVDGHIYRMPTEEQREGHTEPSFPSRAMRPR